MEALTSNYIFLPPSHSLIHQKLINMWSVGADRQYIVTHQRPGDAPQSESLIHPQFVSSPGCAQSFIQLKSSCSLSDLNTYWFCVRTRSEEQVRSAFQRGLSNDQTNIQTYSQVSWRPPQGIVWVLDHISIDDVSVLCFGIHTSQELTQESLQNSGYPVTHRCWNIFQDQEGLTCTCIFWPTAKSPIPLPKIVNDIDFHPWFSGSIGTIYRIYMPEVITGDQNGYLEAY